jgi:uncharacterized protein
MLRRAGAVLATAVAAVLVWSLWIEPASLRNEDHVLEIPGWPSGCDGLRVAVLADLHVGSPFNGLDKLDAIIALTERARPDLILLAGDYVIRDVPGGTFVAPEETAARLAKLSAPLGVFAVLGNHDWWFNGARVRAALESAGIPVLDDASRHLAAGTCALWLVGVSDLWEGRHDIVRALGGVPPGAPILAFTHNPDIFPYMPERVQLTIAGHTHGGQVDLPFVGRPVVPSRYGERYAVGHVVENGRHLFVSSGLGTSILPLRFRVPPEVSVLIIHPSPPALTRSSGGRRAVAVGAGV